MLRKTALSRVHGTVRKNGPFRPLLTLWTGVVHELFPVGVITGHCERLF